MVELSQAAAASEDVRRQRHLDNDDVVAQVGARLYADFGAQTTFADVMSVVSQCRSDLSESSNASLAELLERLARQRLSNRLDVVED
jgi:hypothetical protein